jgi:heat shock protein HslJ
VKLFPSICVGCVALLAASGCAGTKKNPATESLKLSGVEWVLESVGTLDSAPPIADDIRMTLQFDGDKGAAGSTGCNTYRGNYTTKGQSLSFGALSITKKACPGTPGLLALEQRFMAALAEVSRYSIEENVLSLNGPDGAELRLRQDGGA